MYLYIGYFINIGEYKTLIVLENYKICILENTDKKFEKIFEYLNVC